MSKRGGMSNLKKQLIAAMQLPHEDVEVNGVTVRVRALSAEMQMALGEDKRSPAALVFWTAENCLLDPDTGERLFDDDDPSLRDLDAKLLSELVNKAMSLTGLSEAAKN